MNNWHKKLLITCLVLITASGCTSNKLTKFDAFTTAGQTFSSSVLTLTTEASNVAIDTDSQILIRTQNSLSAEKRGEIYSAQTKALKDLLEDMSKFRQHTTLLNNYFTLLGTLITTDEPEQIGTSIDGLITNLQSLSPALTNATVGNAPVNSFLINLGNIAIANHQNEFLQAELERNSITIEKELDLQQAYLTALSEDLAADFKALIKARELNEIAIPYADGKLPKNWLQTRRSLLSTTLMTEALDNASVAATALHDTFVLIIEGKASSIDISLLTNDVNKIIDLIELVKNGPVTEK